jgi:hypothetical protein
METLYASSDVAPNTTPEITPEQLAQVEACVAKNLAIVRDSMADPKFADGTMTQLDLLRYQEDHDYWGSAHMQIDGDGFDPANAAMVAGLAEELNVTWRTEPSVESGSHEAYRYESAVLQGDIRDENGEPTGWTLAETTVREWIDHNDPEHAATPVATTDLWLCKGGFVGLEDQPHA